MNPIADLIRAYVDLIRALAIHIGLLSALAALGITGLAWAIRRAIARRRPTVEPQPDTTSDTRPGPIDETYLRLEAAWRSGTATRRNTH